MGGVCCGEPGAEVGGAVISSVSPASGISSISSGTGGVSILVFRGFSSGEGVAMVSAGSSFIVVMLSALLVFWLFEPNLSCTNSAITTIANTITTQMRV